MSSANGYMVAALAAVALLGCAGSGDKQVAAPKASVAFTSAERDTIRNYYGAQGTAAASGSIKIGDRVTPGSRPQHLPSELHSRLKPLPDPYTWYVLGADIVLVDRNSHEVMDVVPQVVR
jgi:hypothetical protein